MKARLAGQHDKPVTPFRFLDLPAEIRNRIYSLVLASRTTGDISYFRIPAIVRVPRQARKESMPLLFAENNFNINIGSELTEDHGRHTNPARLARPVAVFTQGLQLLGIVERFITSAGDAALFRDITIKVYKSEDMARVETVQRHEAMGLSHEDRTRFHPFAHLHLRVEGTETNIRIEEGADHPRQRKDAGALGSYAENADAVVRQALDVARGIAGRDGFKGFTVEELKKVTRAFASVQG